MKKVGKFLKMSAAFWGIALFLGGLVLMIAVGDCGATLTVADHVLCLHQQRTVDSAWAVIALILWPIFVKGLWSRFRL
jgi:hypothetical protein